MWAIDPSYNYFVPSESFYALDILIYNLLHCSTFLGFLLCNTIFFYWRGLENYRYTLLVPISLSFPFSVANQTCSYRSRDSKIEEQGKHQSIHSVWTVPLKLWRLWIHSALGIKGPFTSIWKNANVRLISAVGCAEEPANESAHPGVRAALCPLGKTVQHFTNTYLHVTHVWFPPSFPLKVDLMVHTLNYILTTNSLGRSYYSVSLSLSLILNRVIHLFFLLIHQKHILT